MDWIITLTLSLFIGYLASFASRQTGLHLTGCLSLSLLGALLGGVLVEATDSRVFGAASIPVIGVVLSIGLITGGLLGSTITKSEKRI